MKMIRCLFVFFFCIGHFYAHAGTGDSAVASSGYVVLVALHAEKNRLREAEKLTNKDIENAIKSDAEQIKKLTIQDFTDNYHQLPVYYFMDSNADKLLKGTYDGILMNADGSVVTSVPAAVYSKKFVVAYYTFPDLQYAFEDVVTDTNRWLESGSRVNRHALVLFNNKFQQFNYYNKRPFDALDADMKKYYYKSKKFDMEYYPLAEKLSTTTTRKRSFWNFFR